jgi:hypothetical protein
MPCDERLEMEKQYRIAMHKYCDAVDRLDSAGDFERAWREIESARTDADRARAALLGHQQKHLCVPLRVSPGLEERNGRRTRFARAPQGTSDPEPDSAMEEIILGDQGQSGG